ncbi:protein L [Pseudomonas sp. SDO528_S397]
MSWWIDSSVLAKSDGNKTWWTKTYGPSDKVPVSGIYRCTGCKKEVTSNADDPFPPQNHHQHSAAQGAVSWKLNVRTNTTGE